MRSGSRVTPWGMAGMPILAIASDMGAVAEMKCAARKNSEVLRC